jgi:hypothetical protein
MRVLYKEGLSQYSVQFGDMTLTLTLTLTYFSSQDGLLQAHLFLNIISERALRRQRSGLIVFEACLSLLSFSFLFVE